MKAIFCIDTTSDHGNKTIDGTELIAAQLPPGEVKKRHSRTGRGLLSALAPAAVPWLFFLSVSASVVALIMLFGGMGDSLSLSEQLACYPGAFIFTGVSIFCTIACLAFMKGTPSFSDWLVILLSGAALLVLLLLYAAKADRSLDFGGQLSCIPFFLMLVLAAFVCLILWRYFKNGFRTIREWLYFGLCLSLLLFCLLIFASEDRNMSFLLRFSRSPGTFITAVICIFVLIACILWNPDIRRPSDGTVSGTEEHTEDEEDDEELRRVLRIPPDQNFELLSILQTKYVRYDDELRSRKSAGPLLSTRGVLAYTDEDSLNLVDLYYYIRLSLPKACMTGFCSIYKDTLHPQRKKGGSQNRAINKSETPPPSLCPDVDYYALELCCGNEDYALYFPKEELLHMQELTGLKAEKGKIPYKTEKSPGLF